MHFIRTQGWDIDIKAHWRQGGAVFGICGGYQMLGTRILDPHGIEGEDRSTEGLGLLDIETTLQPEKHLGLVTGTDESGAAFTGYEIHNGRSKGPDTSRPGFTLEGRPHGARSADGRVAGCYVHGLFDKAGFRQSFLRSMDLAVTGSTDHLATVNAALDEIAEAMERHLDLDTMLRIAQEAP
jgi:adenosylcobyric acid synthase